MILPTVSLQVVGNVFWWAVIWLSYNTSQFSSDIFLSIGGKTSQCYHWVVCLAGSGPQCRFCEPELNWKPELYLLVNSGLHNMNWPGQQPGIHELGSNSETRKKGTRSGRGAGTQRKTEENQTIYARGKDEREEQPGGTGELNDSNNGVLLTVTNGVHGTRDWE